MNRSYDNFILTLEQSATFPVGNGKRPLIKWGDLEQGQHAESDLISPARGIALGRRSGGLMVIDIDVKGGVDGRVAIAEKSQFHPLPETLTVRTPSGGLHLYFYPPEPVGSRNGWLTGVDIKSEGGYVVAPGSEFDPKKGPYRVEKDLPIAALPEPWMAEMPRPKAYRTADFDLQTEPNQDLLELLSASVRHKRGPIWEAWRKVKQGVLPFDFATAQSAGGGVDAFIRLLMMPTLLKDAPEWERVPGAEIAVLMARSMSLLDRACRLSESPHSSKYAEQEHVALKWDASREHVQGDRAARIQEDEERFRQKELETVARLKAEKLRLEEKAEDEAFAEARKTLPAYGSDLPWLLLVNKGTRVLKATVTPFEYLKAVTRDSQLVPACREQWAGVEGAPALQVPSKMGMRAIKPTELYESCYTRIVQNEVTDYTIIEPYLDGTTLYEPASSVKLSPECHNDVHQWLQHLGGDVLLDWVSCVTKLSDACPALWLMGKASVGKTLLAAGLARIWDDHGTPCDAETVFSNFNSCLEDCPLVLADEYVPENSRGFTEINKLKTLITSTSHRINQKGQDIRTLKGAVRLIIASNDIDAIRNMGKVGGRNIEALAQRVVFINVGREHRPATDFIDPSKRIQSEWIDNGAIGEHALWLAENRQVERGSRMIMEASAGQMRAQMLTQPDRHSTILEALQSITSSLAGRGTAPSEPYLRGDAFAYHKGRICATGRAVSDRVKTLGGNLSAVGAGKALKTLGNDRGAYQLTSPTTKRQVSMRGVDPEVILSWSQDYGNPHELSICLDILRRLSQGE